MVQITDNSVGEWRRGGPSALLAALVLLMLSAPLLGPRIGLGMVIEGAFTLVDTLYFSFVALTTVGFGDITPASR